MLDLADKLRDLFGEEGRQALGIIVVFMIVALLLNGGESNSDRHR